MKIYNPSHVGRKKLVYFGAQTKTLLSLINVDPNGLFSGDYILALRGCCALKFLQALKTDQELLAHTPRWDGVPPKNFGRENLKFGLNFSVLRLITSGLVALSSRDFFSVDVPRGRGDNLGTIFTRAAPEICDGHQMFKIRRDFSQLSTLIANISGTDQHIENLKSP